MTRNAARASQFNRQTRRRRGGLSIAALMLGAGLLAAAPPAAAGCSGTPITRIDNTSLGPWVYTCYGHCQAYDSPAHVREIAQYTLLAGEMATCRARCAQDHRCRAVGWHDELVVVHGVTQIARFCTLYGVGTFETADTVAGSRGVNSHMLCILQRWGTQKPNPEDLDIRIDPRDQTRPGVPGPGPAPLKR